MAELPAPQFGVNIDPSPRNLDLARGIAAFADDSGIEFAGIQDHPYIASHLDTWTLLTALAATTRHVRFLPNVLNLPLRPPAVLAKAAATLDLISGGRFEMGLGAGARWDDIAAWGGPRRTPGEAVSALEEAMHVMRLLWHGAEAGSPQSFEGRHYRLVEAKPGPAPAHRIGIWLGALGPRMLDLTGRLADGWSVSIPYSPPAKIPAMQARIDLAAARAGRNTADIRRAYNLMGAISPPGRGGPPARPGAMSGTADSWAEQVVRFYRDLRMDTFIFWPLGGDELAQMRTFAEEVVPAVRREVARGA